MGQLYFARGARWVILAFVSAFVVAAGIAAVVVLGVVP